MPAHASIRRPAEIDQRHGEIGSVHGGQERRPDIRSRFVVVIDPAAISAMDTATVRRAALARGSAHAAPEAIGYHQVVEHELRHLAWLAKEDGAVGATLDDGWHALLADYVPEPFRQLETSEAGGTL